jgi:hypothetical protein
MSPRASLDAFREEENLLPQPEIEPKSLLIQFIVSYIICSPNS